jgi:hypothetical protein
MPFLQVASSAAVVANIPVFELRVATSPAPATTTTTTTTTTMPMTTMPMTTMVHGRR